jgi:hypothetical protein
LAVGVDEDRITAALIDSVYPGHEGCCLSSNSADADGLAFTRNALVADVDVTVAGGKIEAGIRADCDIT